MCRRVKINSLSSLIFLKILLMESPDLKDLSDLIWKVFTPVNVLPGYESHWILMFEYSRGEKHCPAKLPHYQSFCPSLYLFESRLDTAFYKWFPAKNSFDIFIWNLLIWKYGLSEFKYQIHFLKNFCTQDLIIPISHCQKIGLGFYRGFINSQDLRNGVQKLAVFNQASQAWKQAWYSQKLWEAMSTSVSGPVTFESFFPSTFHFFSFLSLQLSYVFSNNLYLLL